MWGTQMHKGQVTILLISILMALALGVMGFFAKNQTDNIELQQMGISYVATSIHMQFPTVSSMESGGLTELFSKEK